MSTPRRRRLVLAAVTAALGVALLEVGARLAIPALERTRRFRFAPIPDRLAEQASTLAALLSGEDQRVQLDSELGWTQMRDHQGEGWSSNAQGVRGRRLYAAVPPPGVVRVAAFGDSFVHAHEVTDTEAWSARAEALDASVEVANYGVGGYGVGQSLLRYRREGAALDPDVVVLGFSDVMASRNLNRYRPFRVAGELPLFKPRFRLEADGELELVPSAFAGEAALRSVIAEPRRILEAGEGDVFYAASEWENPLYPYAAVVRLYASFVAPVARGLLGPDRLYTRGLMKVDSPGFQLLLALVKQFAREVEAAGQSFLFVVFPRADGDIWGEGPRSYTPLLEALPGVETLDLADALSASELASSELRARGGHYSAAANDVVARAILGALPRPGR